MNISVLKANTKFFLAYPAQSLRKGKLLRDVVIVATGTAGAQAIAMAFAPIITRFYGPEAFGLLGTFMALTAILTPVAALSYPIAIVLPKQDNEAKSIAVFSFYLAIAISGVSLILMILAGDWILEVLGLQTISSYLFLIPVAMLFSAFLEVVQQWLIRKREFKMTARMAVVQAFILNGAKAAIGWVSPIATTLIVLATVGNAIHAIMLFFCTRKGSTEEVEETYTKISFREIAYRYSDFPLYRAPQLFLNSISQSLPVLMLNAFFGPSAAGFYTLGKMVMTVPSSLIGKSVGDVFYPRITEAAHNRENLTYLILKATIALAVVGLLPFGLVVAIGPWLFGVVFGAEWAIAGEYSRWLALWMYFMFLNNPCVKALPILSAQGFHLVFTIVTISARLVLLAIGYYVFNSDLIAVSLFGVFGGISNMLLIVIIIQKSRSFGRDKTMVY